MAGQTVSTLKFMITADASELVDGVVLTKKELREVDKLVESSAPAWQKNSSNLSLLSNAYAQGKIGLEDYRRSVNAQRMEMLSSLPIVGQFTGMLNPVTLTATAAAAGVATMTAAVGFLANTVAGRIEEIDRLGDAAARLGVEASTLSRLELSAMFGDVDPTLVESAMTKMLTAVGKGDKAFEKIGMDVDKLKGLRADQLFGAIAAEIAKMPSLSERMGFLGEIGIKDKEILGLLSRFEELNAEAERSGAIVGDELASRVGKADDSLKKLRASLTGMANDMTYFAVPAVTATVDGLSTLARDAQQTTSALEGVGRILGGNTGALLGRALGGGANAARDFVRQEQLNRQPIRPDAGNRVDLEEDAKQREAIDKAETSILDKEERRADAAHAAIEAIREQRHLLGATVEQAMALRAEKLKMTDDEKAELTIQAQLLEFEKQRLATARDYSRQAIKDIDAAEAIKSAGKTPAELAQERVDEAARLKGMGLLSEAEFVRESERAAAAIRSGAGFGGVSAQQGSAAAREAVLMAGKQDEQLRTQKEMAKHLRTIASKKAVPLEVVSE